MDGKYVPETDVEQLESSMSRTGTCLSDSVLPSIPSWIKQQLLREPFNDNSNNSYSFIPPTVMWEKCDSWKTEFRSEIRCRFFRREANVRIWNHKPVAGMKDRSQSGYEFQLAMRLMNVGATDAEIAICYRVWCGKHLLKRKDRFFSHIIAAARLATADYLEEWKAMQPTRRRHGTTMNQIREAIKAGHTKPAAMVKFTGLKGSTVRMHLKRLVDDGRLVKGASGYAIPGVCSPEVELLVA